MTKQELLKALENVEDNAEIRIGYLYDGMDQVCEKAYYTISISGHALDIVTARYLDCEENLN